MSMAFPDIFASSIRFVPASAHPGKARALASLGMVVAGGSARRGNVERRRSTRTRKPVTKGFYPLPASSSNPDLSLEHGTGGGLGALASGVGRVAELIEGLGLDLLIEVRIGGESSDKGDGLRIALPRRPA